MLQEIPNLSEDNQFEVAEILVDKPSFLEMFMGLPESAKPAYVYRLLKNKKQVADEVSEATFVKQQYVQLLQASFAVIFAFL